MNDVITVGPTETGLWSQVWSLSILDGSTCLGTFGVAETININGQTFGTSVEAYLPTTTPGPIFVETFLAGITSAVVTPQVVTFVFSSYLSNG